MPTYDYHCAANGRTVEVKHRMSESVNTWQELCALAGLAVDGTPGDSPVAKVLTPTFVAGASNLGCDACPPIVNGGHCHSGMCGH